VPSIHNPNLPLKHPQKQKTQPKLELKPLKNPPKPHSHQTPRASLFDDDISNRVTTLIGETLSIQDSIFDVKREPYCFITIQKVIKNAFTI
jgi:hypothetical protein